MYKEKPAGLMLNIILYIWEDGEHQDRRLCDWWEECGTNRDGVWLEELRRPGKRSTIRSMEVWGAPVIPTPNRFTYKVAFWKTGLNDFRNHQHTDMKPNKIAQLKDEEWESGTKIELVSTNREGRTRMEGRGKTMKGQRMDGQKKAKRTRILQCVGETRNSEFR